MFSFYDCSALAGNNKRRMIIIFVVLEIFVACGIKNSIYTGALYSPFFYFLIDFYFCRLQKSKR